MFTYHFYFQKPKPFPDTHAGKKPGSFQKQPKKFPKMVLVDPFQVFQSLIRMGNRIRKNWHRLTAGWWAKSRVLNFLCSVSTILIRMALFCCEQVITRRHQFATCKSGDDFGFTVSSSKTPRFEVIIVLASSWQPCSCPSWSIPWGETKRDLLQRNLEKKGRFSFWKNLKAQKGSSKKKKLGFWKKDVSFQHRECWVSQRFSLEDVSGWISASGGTLTRKMVGKTARSSLPILWISWFR